MRKMKKIGGYLVVKFNDKEIREWGSALGTFGVIDEELYTGCLDIDKGALEFDGIDNIDEAIEQARGLVFPEELTTTKTEPLTPKTISITEEDDLIAEVCDGICGKCEKLSQEELDEVCETCPLDELAARLRRFEPVVIEGKIAAWDAELRQQIKSNHYPGVNVTTAKHEFYGYLVALKDLGLICSDKCFVMPNHFGTEDPKGDFMNLSEIHRGATSKRVYTLGLGLEKNCPENDCRIYLNIFNMCREIDEQIDSLTGWPRELLVRELCRQYRELEGMFMTNYAVREHKRKAKEPTEKRTTPWEGKPKYTAEAFTGQRRE